jgi:cell division protein FtsB
MKGKKIYRVASNKYVLSLLVFIVWVGFFDRNNFVSQYKLNRELNRLEHEKNFYVDQIEKDSKARDDLVNNIDIIEKYAREKHLMKRENEDIFLIIRKEKEE